VTSVAYTIPASASPALTLPTTPRTFSSFDTRLASAASATPSCCSATRAYAPAGTLGPASTRRSPGAARSPGPATPEASTGVISTSRFLANRSAAAILPLAIARRICGSSAATNTSTGAPSAICPARICEPAKLNTTSTPGCRASKSGSSPTSASFSDIAADTRSSRAAPSPLQADSATPARSTSPRNIAAA
jgi:hypothetical protein